MHISTDYGTELANLHKDDVVRVSEWEMFHEDVTPPTLNP